MSLIDLLLNISIVVGGGLLFGLVLVGLVVILRFILDRERGKEMSTDELEKFVAIALVVMAVVMCCGTVLITRIALG